MYNETDLKKDVAYIKTLGDGLMIDSLYVDTTATVIKAMEVLAGLQFEQRVNAIRGRLISGQLTALERYIEVHNLYVHCPTHLTMVLIFDNGMSLVEPNDGNMGLLLPPHPHKLKSISIGTRGSYAWGYDL